MRRALITGGASGLGAALLVQAQAAGWDVTAIDRAPAPPGFTGTWAVADLADPLAPARLAPLLAGAFDLVVLCAGISATGQFEAIPEDTAQAVIDVNLTAPLILTAQLLAQGALPSGARLVLIGSLSTFTGYPGAAVYAGTKDGLRSLARSLRRPLARQGITVTYVAPGPMDTPHAAQHAPPGATGRGRTDPARVAAAILAGGRGGVLVPGLGAKALATLGRVAPRLATGLMRRAIYVRYTDLSAQPEPRKDPT